MSKELVFKTAISFYSNNSFILLHVSLSAVDARFDRDCKGIGGTLTLGGKKKNSKLTVSCISLNSKRSQKTNKLLSTLRFAKHEKHLQWNKSQEVTEQFE